ncbi:MAG: GatB/YqeY domain-containing protein [Clostridia bacterium]|jgi:uncharacterized protein YqeY|nr:GatB/YqeY domain-containing protein [Clostridia bacterium]
MLKDELLGDLKNAMKEKDDIKKNAIQMVRAAILQVEKDKSITLQDNQIIEIIAKEVKKRKDSISDYQKGGRQDIVEQIEKEIEILSKYLPKQLTKQEIEDIVKQVIQKVGATSIKDMGKVMKQAKEEMGVSAEGKVINQVVKELLD